MKTTLPLFLWLLFFVGNHMAVRPAAAADSAPDPLISLTVNNQPLGDVLDAITAETGYEFNLNSQWEAHPVSATIDNLPLEQGLKRLLRSLNHTILWESDQIITISIFGKADSTTHPNAISHAAPVQPLPETEDPGDIQEDSPPDEEAPASDEHEREDGEEDAPPDDEEKPDHTLTQD